VTATHKAQRSVSSQVEVTARGDRHALEALYLELRELAKQNGLQIEYRLTAGKPKDQPDS
jgi:hypothetical protein